MTEPAEITQADREAVEVTQADRKAAVALLYLIWSAEHGNVVYGWMRDEESKTLRGWRDQEWAVQAFARHRIASTTALTAENERLQEALAPFALHIRPEVDDCKMITTVAWTAGQHRAALAALAKGSSHGG